MSLISAALFALLSFGSTSNASQRYQCELNSSALTLLMTGDTGRIENTASNGKPEQLPAEDRENLEKLVRFVESNPGAVGYRRFPWLDNFLASEKQRLYAFHIAVDPLKINDGYMSRYMYRRFSKDWDKNIVERTKAIDSLYAEVEALNQAGNPPRRVALEQLKAEMKESGGRSSSFFQAAATSKIRTQGAAKACRDLGAVNPDECLKAAIYSHDKIMNPTDIRTYRGASAETLFADLSNLEMSVEVLDSSQDDPYLRGLRNYERKLVEHLKSPRQIAANIFQDLTESFVESGDTAERAQIKTLNVLSVVSTNGSDFILNEQTFFILNEQTFNRLYREKVSENGFINDKAYFEPANPKFVTLVRISMALPYFDLTKPGNLYSLPSNVVSDCNTSKYYHFWISAYLMKRLMAAGFSKEASAAAILVNHVGYRTLYDPFASKFDPESAPAFILRTDLAGVYSGILFASRLGTSKQDEAISFQQIFESIDPDPNYKDPVMDLAAIAIPSVKVYGEFMKNLGFIPLWRKLKFEL